MPKSDKTLLEAISKGDQKAFENLIDQYQPRIFNFAYRILELREDAQDVAQDTFLKIYEKSGDLAMKQDLNLRAYIYKVAQNLSIDELNRRNKTVLRTDISAEDTNVYQDPERALLLKEQIKKVSWVASTLAEGHRVILTLRELHEMDYTTIADVMGMTRGNVGVLLLRARLKFKEAYIMGEFKQENLSVECKQMLPLISAYYDNEVTPEQRMKVEQHLNDCPHCKIALDEITEASTSYRALLPLATPVAIKTGTLTKAGTMAAKGAVSATKTGMSIAMKVSIGIATIAVIAAGIAGVILVPRAASNAASGASIIKEAPVKPKEYVSQIAFVRNDDVWTVEVDKDGKAVPGSEKPTVESPGTKEKFPVWSSDGSKLAYIVEYVDDTGAYKKYLTSLLIAGSEGQNPRIIADTKEASQGMPYFQQIEWTSNDSSIAVSVQDGAHTSRLWLVEVSSGKVDRLGAVTTRGFAIDLAGKFLAVPDYTIEGKGFADGSYYPVTFAGNYRNASDPQQLTVTPDPQLVTERLNYRNPIWISDNAFFVFEEVWSKSSLIKRQLIEMNLKGEKIRTVVDVTGGYFSFSKDKSFLVAESFLPQGADGQGSDISTINVKTGAKTIVTSNASSPSWSPVLLEKRNAQ